MTHDADKVSRALETVFDEISDFIVIGLTGRTGSGCSTAAYVLSLENLPLPDTANSHYAHNELKKYRIVKKYIDKRWQPFEWLQVSTIITRYLIELNFSEFLRLVTQILDKDMETVRSVLNEIKDEYDEAHRIIKYFLDLSEDSPDGIGLKKEKAYNIYFEWLPGFSNKLKDCLNKISHGSYVAVYQKVGDNIRASGKAGSDKFDPERVFGFAKTINKVIKSASFVAKKRKKKCYIVIDAIRNPYEAIFLRERYADFYLVSINTDDSDRLRHLRNSHKFTDIQIKNLDDKEYPSKLTGYKKYTSQNIQKCIELSDIHINNPRKNQFGTSELASQLAWYVSLMMHPGLIMPTSVESCMQLAYSVRKNSGCISRQVGAVVTDKNYSIKAVGWNNTPQGQVPCLLRNAEDLIDGIDLNSYSHYEKNDEKFRNAIETKFTSKTIVRAQGSGRNLAFCFKDIQNEIENEKNQVHTRSLHAEENAFLQISKYGGQELEGGILFTTASPCELCSKKAYQLGISKIFYIDPYPGISTNHVLSSGCRSPELILFRGAVGIAFHRLYQPVMPYKDELEMFLSIPKKENKKDTQIKKLQEENDVLKEKIVSLEARFKVLDMTDKR